MKIVLVAVLIFLLNLPFGAWRRKTRKFSLAWFLSIHLPIPGVLALRFLSGLGYQWETFPAIIGAIFLGQMAGSQFLNFPSKNKEP